MIAWGKGSMGEKGKASGDLAGRPSGLTAEETRFWGFLDGSPSDADILPPPYSVAGVDMIFIGVRHREEAIGSVLPKELKPLPGLAGTVCVFRAARGWVIAPYSACFMTIEVEGYPSPDGSPGYYMAAGHFSNRAGEIMRRDYNINFLDGGSRQVREGEILHGYGGPPGADALHLAIRPSGDAPLVSGVHNYIGRNRSGGLNLYSVAYSGPFQPAEVVAVDILDAATDTMKALRPAEVLWGLEVPGLSMTYSAPRLITDAAAIAGDSLQVTLLDIFTRLRRPAMVIGREGSVIFMNPQADALAAEAGIVDGRRRLGLRREDRTALIGLVESAIDRTAGSFDLAPIAIDRPHGGRPLIVQAMPIDPAVGGGAAALVLFADPASTGGGDPTRALQLLGLTPAEAKVAALVGSGMAPKEAARKLGNTEGTVRAALTHVYQKLDIGRQSELAKIVARLDSISS